VSANLNAKFDVVVSRIGAPYNLELALGAIVHDGTFFPNRDIIKILDVPQMYIKEQISAQMKEIEQRLLEFRGTTKYNNLEAKTVVLVDDSIATYRCLIISFVVRKTTIG
jgi:putative phosphoribosyl transferase